MTDQKSLGLKETQPPASVEEYKFEPIKGYPMLHWQGKRPFTSTLYYPAQHKETHGPAVDGWRNKIYWGDNLQIMSHLLKQNRGQVKLVYIDPPFDSKADYRKSIRLRGQDAKNDLTAFEEKQYTDIWTNDEYLQFMYERLILIRELLSDDGSLYVHCDYRMNSYLRLILDELFGKGNFLNQITWQRIYSHSDAKRFGVVDDNLLLYSKSNSYVFNRQYKPHSESYKKSHYSQSDKNGRRYRLVTLSAAGAGPPRSFADRVIAPPPGRHWAWSQERIDEGMANGTIVFTSKGQPNIKMYLDESKGTVVQTIWDDMFSVNPASAEMIGYPTQKPESLLTRILKASSNPGDLVFDCFMGSGTTQAVAMKLGRRFIGADINLGAVQITTKRLLGMAQELERHQPTLDDDADENAPTAFYTGFEVYNVNHYDIFRNPAEAKDLLVQALELHPLEQSHLFDGEKDGRLWKIMPVNRIATRADLNPLITGFDYKAFEKRQADRPNQPVERITLVCMGHEPDLAATLQKQAMPYEIDVEVVDILRDRSDLQFKRDSEVRISVRDGHLAIEAFYPMNLLQKLSLPKEHVEDWREMVESVMIDWNYDGAILEPALVDIPGKTELVAGRYPIPPEAGTIRVEITDLLSESLEVEVQHG